MTGLMTIEDFILWVLAPREFVRKERRVRVVWGYVPDRDRGTFAFTASRQFPVVYEVGLN